MWTLKFLKKRLKNINYTMIEIWKKLCEKDLNWYTNLKEDELYKSYQRYSQKYKIIKELYLIELELYNFNELNNITFQIKLDL